VEVITYLTEMYRLPAGRLYTAVFHRPKCHVTQAQRLFFVSFNSTTLTLQPHRPIARVNLAYLTSPDDYVVRVNHSTYPLVHLSHRSCMPFFLFSFSFQFSSRAATFKNFSWVELS